MSLSDMRLKHERELKRRGVVPASHHHIHLKKPKISWSSGLHDHGKMDHAHIAEHAHTSEHADTSEHAHTSEHAYTYTSDPMTPNGSVVENPGGEKCYSSPVASCATGSQAQWRRGSEQRAGGLASSGSRKGLLSSPEAAYRMNQLGIQML